MVLALVTDPDAVGGGWSALAQATGGAEAGAAPERTPDAVDSLTHQLRARYVVTFTPPAGASSARVTLTASGEESSADVPLASTPGHRLTGPRERHPRPASGAGRAGRRCWDQQPGPLIALVAVAVVGRWCVGRSSWRARSRQDCQAGRIDPAGPEPLVAEPPPWRRACGC